MCLLRCSGEPDRREESPAAAAAVKAAAGGAMDPPTAAAAGSRPHAPPARQLEPAQEASQSKSARNWERRWATCGIRSEGRVRRAKEGF